MPMASSSFLLSSTPTTNISTSPFVQTLFFPKTTQISISKKLKKPYYSAPTKVVSCKSTKNGSQQNPTASKNNGDSALNRFNRRDVLIGLGGIYGANNLVGKEPFASAAPITVPDLPLCDDRSTADNIVYCYPSRSPNIIDFIKPPPVTKLRYRPAAHLVTPDYSAKFAKAVELMKALPDDDPRSFKFQANLYNAYYNGAYDEVGLPDLDIEVNLSWLFFPFHRMYLYFFERILGKLIDEPDFAMPFWNWDSPPGMTIPAIYDSKRNNKLVNLNYNGSGEEPITRKDQIVSNLAVMHRQMVLNSKSATLFFGHPYRAGDNPSPGMGSIENIRMPILRSISSVFDEDGSIENIRMPILRSISSGFDEDEDMGNFYSVGRDAMFYGLHANADRLWTVWERLPGDGRHGFADPDWLETQFYFYDLNANLARVKVSDFLDNTDLGYAYEPVDIPWLRTKPVPFKFATKKVTVPTRWSHGHAMAAERKKNVIRSTFPLALDKIVSIEVPRPKKLRTKFEKEDEEEVLAIENIQLQRDVAVKFDVYINDEKPKGPENSEFAGSFTNLPHNLKRGKQLSTNLTLGITDLLEDLDVEGDDSIIVTLVPKAGKGKVTIGNIKIDYIR